MGAIIRYENGLRVQAILLSANDQKLRAAISSERDSIELLKVGNSWMTERGEVVEIESLMQIPGVDATRFFTPPAVRTLTAGRSFSDF